MPLCISLLFMPDAELKPSILTGGGFLFFVFNRKLKFSRKGEKIILFKNSTYLRYFLKTSRGSEIQLRRITYVCR